MAGLEGSRRWELLPHDLAAERTLAADLGVAPLAARVLAARGMTDPDEVRRFLAPDLVRDWEPPLDIPGMREACDRVEMALMAGERIAVYGDFDVDGMTATGLLTLALRRLGGTVEPYIPHRFDEGYGLSRGALSRVMDGCDPQLVITVDNGIAAGREVAWLLDQGVDVVITDHHEPGDLVPTGVPVADPKLSAQGASRELAGAGVALKMVCELGRRLGQGDLWREYTDLAMLGTVSDMMLLLGENRSLVADGIALLRRGRRPGIVALAAVAGIDLSSITSDELPFSLVPRLNAAGRMGTTDVAFDLLVSEDPVEASRLAALLEETNTQRREIEGQLAEAAIAQAEASYDGGRSIVVAGEGWHEGVKGIVASRLVSRYHVPSIVFTISDGMARGSGRSVGSVDLFHALEQCSDVLVRFGGHEGAVGVTCEESKLDVFRRRFDEALAQLPADQFESRGEVSALVDLDELTVESIASLEVLQPFGQGNKRPLFATRGVLMRNRACVGATGAHLRFTVTDGMTDVPAIMFRVPDIGRAASCEGVVDLVFDAVNETWQGRTNPKLMVRDILYRDEAIFGEDGEAHHVSVTSNPQQGASQPVPAERQASGSPTSGDPLLSRARYRSLGPSALVEELCQQMIGGQSLLAAQRVALEQLAAGRSTLAVMATGRGKSLIFQLHAARLALLEGRSSIFVYPLRALVNDQALHLSGIFAEWGLTCAVLTGETSGEDRERAYDALARGDLDVVMTTPEYLALHVDRLAQAQRVGFVVVDEAHHAGDASWGNREAYLSLPTVLARLGDPTVLAVTATAATPCATEICRLLRIDAQDVVVDRSVRSNLRVRDCRGVRGRDLALAHVVASGAKCVTYVNSRAQSVSIVRALRRAIPELAERMAFYHAGMPHADRLRVERALHDGDLCCIVSTSAFGEGVNLPDIRDVILYHMPFGWTEFNQMSGRAGRDGDEAVVHLMYGLDDARINEGILAAASPDRTGMAAIYRALRARVTARGVSDVLAMGEAETAELLSSLDPRLGLTDASVEAALGVFEELRLLSLEGQGGERAVRMEASPSAVSLESSVRYVEGQRERAMFDRFRDWALSADVATMLAQINRPITPDFGQVIDG